MYIMDHDQKEGKRYDNETVCRKDGGQLSNRIELVGGGISSGRGAKQITDRGILGDSRKRSDNGASETWTQTLQIQKSSEIDPFTLPYVMMSESKFLPTCSGVYFAIEESGQVA
jgi:hypothetical protein